MQTNFKIWLMNTSHKSIFKKWFKYIENQTPEDAIIKLSKKRKKNTLQQYVRVFIQFGLIKTKTQFNFENWNEMIEFIKNGNEVFELLISNEESFKESIPNLNKILNENLNSGLKIIKDDAKLIVDNSKLYLNIIKNSGTFTRKELSLFLESNPDVKIESQKNKIVSKEKIFKELKGYNSTNKIYIDIYNNLLGGM